MKARLLLGLVVSGAFAARADVVDLSKSTGRSDSDLGGFSVRAEFGNDFAPYGLVGVALSWVAPTGTAFEGGAGAGFPGVQLGFNVRQLFATGGGFNIAIELGIAGNTKQQRASNVVTTGADTSRYIWTNLGGGFELRPGPFSFSAIAALAFTPADGEAHFGFHGGIGYYF
ncbi:MAG TPA: hypothetical protein VG496_05095 [Myxococcales bacterium]|nr:hypothetical protein [Myxococcales bacterium]